MKVANVLLPAAFAAIATVAAAAPSTTDEARAEAAQRITAAERAAALLPYEPVGSKVVRVTDTESARSAAAQANERHVRDSHRAEVLRAGAGVQPAPIKVTDTDSARAAAAQQARQQALSAEYAEYQQTQARRSANSAVR